MLRRCRQWGSKMFLRDGGEECQTETTGRLGSRCGATGVCRRKSIGSEWLRSSCSAKDRRESRQEGLLRETWRLDDLQATAVQICCNERASQKRDLAEPPC